MKVSSITDADRLRNMCNHLHNYDYIKEDLREIADKLDSTGIGNIPEKEDLYRSKLIALLEGLECENIPKLVKEGTVGMYEEIGIEIAKEVKDLKNIPFDVMKSLDTKITVTPIPKEDTDVIKDALQYHLTGENNALEFYEGDDEKNTIKIIEHIQEISKKLGIELE